MRPTLFLSALAGLTVAMPHDSAVDTGLSVMEAPASLQERDKSCKKSSFWLCYTLPKSLYGQTVNPDNPAAFQAYSPFSQAAINAVTPAGYLRSFQNFNSTTSNARYLGFRELSSYNTATCAAKCDEVKHCVAFNIYFERDPSTTTDATCCPNPPSLTRIKCTLWGVPTSDTTANNIGMSRDSFRVVMAGSNGYNRITLPRSSSSSTARTSMTSSNPSVTSAKSSASSSKASSTSSTSSSSTSSSKVSSGGSSAGSSKTSAASSAGSSAGSFKPALNTPSVTTSPTMSSSSSSLSGLAVSSQSASQASDAAAETVTDPGSPVTASIATSSTPCATPVQTPEITFNLNRTTDGTQTIWIYGSIDQLGEWDPDSAVALSSYDYTPTNTNWFVSLNITLGTSFEYKYYQRNQNWSITWPPTDNRMYTVPSSCQSNIVINDKWQ